MVKKTEMDNQMTNISYISSKDRDISNIKQILSKGLITQSIVLR